MTRSWTVARSRRTMCFLLQFFFFSVLLYVVVVVVVVVVGGGSFFPRLRRPQRLLSHLRPSSLIRPLLLFRCATYRSVLLLLQIYHCLSIDLLLLLFCFCFEIFCEISDAYVTYLNCYYFLFTTH